MHSIQGAAARSTAAGNVTSTETSAAKTAIEKVLKEYDAGWKTRDPSLIANCYSRDAYLQNPFGVDMKGQATIHAWYKGLFQTPEMKHRKDTPSRIFHTRMLGPDAAVVRTHKTVTGQTDSLGESLGKLNVQEMRVFQKIGEHWVVTEHSITNSDKDPLQ
jgi:uncharacterized protein (TIGR02246 family)